MIRTTLYHSDGQRGPVLLPSEYLSDKASTETKRTFAAVKDSSFEVYALEEAGGTLVIVTPQCKSSPYWDHWVHLFVTDTISLTPNEFRSLRPYIRSKHQKIYFCAATTDRMMRDTIIMAEHRYLPDGDVLQFWQGTNDFTESELRELKQSTFVLRDLYYTRGRTTYFLDRCFVLNIR